MNKQEAINKLKKHRVGFGDATSVSFARAVSVIGQIHEPQKVVIPQFVDEWIEKYKKQGKTLYMAMDVIHYSIHPSRDWFEVNQETFARAWLDGYEIEQEKLYTVRIPNPNRKFFPYTLYRNDDGKIIIIGAGDDYEKREEYHLTESEIKQDFEFLWQFAKEVE